MSAVGCPVCTVGGRTRRQVISGRYTRGHWWDAADPNGRYEKARASKMLADCRKPTNLCTSMGAEASSGPASAR